MLIVVIQAGILFLGEQINSMFDESGQLKRNIGELSMFMLASGTMTLMVIWVMLQAGFLSTAIRGGDVQQNPNILVIEGKRFFWRMFRFNLFMYAILLLIVQLVIGLLVGANAREGVPVFYQTLSALFAMIILTRPVLLIPAIMLVENCLVFEAFSRTRKYSFERGKLLLMVYWIGMAMLTLPELIFPDIKSVLIRDVFLVVYSMIGSIFLFYISYTAVRMVSGIYSETVKADSDTDDKRGIVE